MASLSLHNTTKALVIALLSAGLLTACGGGGSTNRDAGPDDGGTTTPETTYKLTISSPVAFKNVNVRIINLANEEVAKGTIADGNNLVLDIKSSNTGKYLIAEISANGSSSSYFDPTLNKFAPFNTTLHRVFGMLPQTTNASINPFTEIAYQRVLVRSGSMDQTKPDISNISLTDIVYAEDEIASVFRIGISSEFQGNIPEFSPITKQSDYAALVFKDQENPPNTKPQYLNAFFALGHYLVQQKNNPADTTPYMTFAKRAAEDMRDGSLDGLTIVGDGTDTKSNSYTLNNPIIGPSPLNTDPALNIIKNFDPNKPNESNLGTLKGTQKAVREAYAQSQRNTLIPFMESLPSNDTLGLAAFKGFNFAEGYNSVEGGFTTTTFAMHSFGAGNYKRAFGIEPVILKKGETQLFRDIDCVGTYYTENREEAAITPKTSDCMIGLNADGQGPNKPYNTIEALVGKYTGTESCKLTVSFTGHLSLTKGGQTFNASINRDESDALIRTEANPAVQSYLLNVASTNKDPVEFIQLKVVNQKVISAVAGTSTQKYPKVLDNQKLSCTFQYGS